MGAYLTFIGVANLIGGGLLLGAMSDTFSDGLLRRWTAILPADTPFAHSAYSRIWLWWAVIGTFWFGACNLVATTWPPEIGIWVVWGNIYAYGCFEALAIAGSLSPRYGPGVHVCHALWIGQGGWGVLVATGVLA